MTRDIERPKKETDPDAFLKKAKRLALNVYNTANEHTSYPTITEDQVFVVWFSKTLQNWKALVSTSVPLDTSYFEVTYNGDKGETYVDWYFKHSNTTIPDPPEVVPLVVHGEGFANYCPVCGKANGRHTYHCNNDR